MTILFRAFTYTIALFFLTSCSNIFELDSDVQARQALFDLMEAQDKFYQDNNKYAGKLFEIEKYNTTVLVTSISGYSDLFDQDTLKAFELLKIQKNILLPIIEDHNGISLLNNFPRNSFIIM